MNIHIDNIFLDSECLKKIYKEVQAHSLILGKIMATQEELLVKVNATQAGLDKLASDVRAYVKQLEDAIDALDEVSPELEAAVDGLRGMVQALDDEVPEQG